MEHTTILEELERTGYIVIFTKGDSMRPLLRTYYTHVLIRKLNGRPKKYDAVLYVRPDGTQVLHRIMGFEGDVCLIRGDNTFSIERVPLSAIKGVAETIWRGDKEIHATDRGYNLFVWFWHFIYPLRHLKHSAKRVIAAIGK